MKKIFTIIKKELKRFFGDRRMLFSLILPGLVIFIVYSLMGVFISKAFESDANHEYIVAVVNKPDSFQIDKGNFNLTFVEHNNDEVEEIKKDVHDEKIDLLICYSETFDIDLEQNTVTHLEIFYNSNSTESQIIYEYIYGILVQDSAVVSPKYTINGDSNISYDLVTKEEESASFMTMILPFLLVILLFSGCMGVSTESIAGEKERGTIATLLITPVKRSHIAIGKILALSITSLVSALSSFIGVMLSLPKIVQGVDITTTMYGVGTYLGIFAILIVTVMIFVVILSIISAFAKSIKEASQYAMPVMMIVMFICIPSMIGTGNIASNAFLYLIPVYNSVQCLSGFFAMDVNPLFVILTIISNIVYIGLGVFILTRMFNSDKIMYNK